ncbi:MAG TPA: hypothetical protein VFF31_14695 [Blastocatellia bacterium]|nr:hypothetical protein [Blastocatellia bacterium]
MAKGPKAVPNFIWGLLSFAFDTSQSAVFEGKAKLAISDPSTIRGKGRLVSRNRTNAVGGWFIPGMIVVPALL